MKNIVTNTLFFSLLFLLFACEKEAKDIELPQVDPKLVAYCYLNPEDSVIELSLSKSVPYFGKNIGNIYNPVTDATVVLSGEDGSVQLPYSFESETYKISVADAFPIYEGKTYTLRVNAPGGFNISAQTTVPVAAPIQVSVELDSTIKTSNGFKEKVYRITTRFNDIRGRRNFYESAIGIYQGGIGDPSNTFNFCTRYVTDENNDGKQFTLTCEYSNFFSDGTGLPQGIKGVASINIADVSYYKFHYSLSNYTADNPFAEPSRIFSNIEGGLGCFGSYVNIATEF